MYEVLLGDYHYKVIVTHFREGCPAHVSGLPEDCFPAEETELEWEALTGDTATDYLLNNCSEQMEDTIHEQLLDFILSEEHDADA
jgi:hypothetical protein